MNLSLPSQTSWRVTAAVFSAVVCLVMMACQTGCQRLGPLKKFVARTPFSAGRLADKQTPIPPDQPARLPKAADAGDTLTPVEAAEAIAAGTASLSTMLASDEWVSPVTPDAGAVFHWRHIAGERLLAAGDDAQRGQMRRALKSPNGVIVANAAIVLGRLGDETVADHLETAIQSSDLREPQRCAAAEVLARIEGPHTIDILQNAIERYGTSETRRSEASLPKLHATLIRGLARHVDPSTDVRFREALSSPVGLVRRAALAAWSQGTKGNVPIEAIDLRTDSDLFTRVAALNMISNRNVPRAVDYLSRALSDYEPQVKLAAVAGLGELDDLQARETLQRLLRHSSARTREAAVAALGGQGDNTAVFAAADDKSWRVRRAVASVLADSPTAEATALAIEMIEDRSGQVQQEIVKSLSGWPLEHAGPLLLDALEKSTYATRKAAVDVLKTRWPPAASYSADAPSERRAEILADLRSQWTEQFGEADFDRAANLSRDEAVSEQTVSPQRLEQIAQQVASMSHPGQTTTAMQITLAELDNFGTDLIPALSQLVRERGLIVPELVYREVLPRHSELFEIFVRLAAPEVGQRRVASAKLARQVAEAGLGQFELERLAALIVEEPDTLVWRNILAAITDESGETAARIAYAALSHPAAEVRRRGCLYLEAHPSARHASVLVATLSDRNGAVLRAAVRALGHCGELADPAPLESMLSSTDSVLQLLTARSLTMLDYPSGNAALERMVHDVDHRVRRGAAEAMGELASSSQGSAYVPALIGLLDDRLDVRHTALKSLEQIAGRNMALEPGETTVPPGEQKIRWQRWWKDQQQTGVRTGDRHHKVETR